MAAIETKNGILAYWGRPISRRKNRRNSSNDQITDRLKLVRTRLHNPKPFSPGNPTLDESNHPKLKETHTDHQTLEAGGIEAGKAFLTALELFKGGSKAVSSTTSTLSEVSTSLGDNLESLICGEVSEMHVKQVLSMRLECRDVGEKDICGLNDVKQLIRNKIIAPIRRPDLHRGLYCASRGILFFGPPGTGKTTLAKWIATESGAAFFNVTASTVISKYHGETETLVRSLFLVAERLAPTVIFIDEIDGLIAKRRDKEEDTTLRMKNQLLQMMDGVATSPKTVIVIGATNRPDSLDEAALRRLSKRIYIPLPDVEARKGQIHLILSSHVQDLLGNDHTTGVGLNGAEIERVAKMTEGYNGSDLKALCGKAAEFAYEEGLQVYGGNIELVPGSWAFRLPEFSDFEKAITSVKKSSTKDDFFLKWAEELGCS